MNPIDPTASIKEIYIAHQRRFDAPHTLDLQFHKTGVQLKTNSKRLHHQLKAYFRDFARENASEAAIEILAIEDAPPWIREADLVVKRPDPGKKKIKEASFDTHDGRVVKKILTGMVFCFGNGYNLAVGPCEDNGNQIVNFINNRFIEQILNRGWQLGHAAAIHHEGRGLAICGFSGMGKSTLSLHLMREGTHFVSNDRVMIKKKADRTDLLGVAKWPRVNPGTLLNNPDLAGILPEEKRRTYDDLPPESLWHLEEKYDVIVPDYYGTHASRIATPLDLLVVLNWRDRGAPFKVSAVDWEEQPHLLDAFMKDCGLFYFPSPEMSAFDRAKAAYVNDLKPVPVVEFSGGVDFKQGCEFCLHYLETGTL